MEASGSRQKDEQKGGYGTLEIAFTFWKPVCIQSCSVPSTPWEKAPPEALASPRRTYTMVSTAYIAVSSSWNHTRSLRPGIP